MNTSLNTKLMILSLDRLDKYLTSPVELIIGGGGAMLLAHDFPLSTTDIDAIPRGLTIEELKPFILQVAKELDLPPDWLNPWFSSFTHVLSADYGSRLKQVYKGQNLTAQALGENDLLVMKCFAHRKKDIAHARALVRKKADTEFVFNRISELKKKKIPGCKEAADFLEEIIDLEDA